MAIVSSFPLQVIAMVLMLMAEVASVAFGQARWVVTAVTVLIAWASTMASTTVLTTIATAIPLCPFVLFVNNSILLSGLYVLADMLSVVIGCQNL